MTRKADQAEGKASPSPFRGQGSDGQQAHPSRSQHGNTFRRSGKDRVGRVECGREGLHQYRSGVAELRRHFENALLGRKNAGAKPTGQIVNAQNPSLWAMGREAMVAIRALDFILSQGLVGGIDLGHKSAVCLIHGQDFMADDLRQGKGEEASGQIR